VLLREAAAEQPLPYTPSEDAMKTQSSSIRRSRVYKPLLFLTPAIIVYGFVMVYPMIYSLLLSLYPVSGLNIEFKGLGLQNYKTLLFHDPVFWESLKNNGIWMGLALVIPMFLGLLVAQVLNRNFRGRIIFRALYYYPSILSLTATGLIWVWMYNPQLGLLNSFLKTVGIKGTISWLGNMQIALFSVFAADVWMSVGFAMVLFLGGMQSIPNELYEAAYVEGANKTQSFFRITIPLLRESLIVITVLYMIGSMKIFDIIFAMTLGGPGRSTYVLAVYMYFNAFKFFKLGMGSAVAWIMVILVAIIVIPYVSFMSRDKDR
jgi:raffinose/stachyose/melibiose transport system permease protein